ncbi:hypothetical protein COTS27_00791 [Spirochaetota bacterium]|nr:hypothetical protein COTS27_00791 [Spirochaetota bacterium]
MKDATLYVKKYRYIYLIIGIFVFGIAPLFKPSLKHNGFSKMLLYGNQATIKEYYAILSTKETDTLEKRIKIILDKKWKNVPAAQSFKTTDGSERENFAAQIKAYHQVVPNIKWEPIKIIKAQNTYTVITKITGTPESPFFNVPPSGKSFEILSIEVHKVVAGKIRESFHVEDWVNAISQIAEP